MAAIALDSEADLSSELAVAFDQDKKELHLALPPPGILSQAVVAEVKPMHSTPLAAETGKEGSAGEGEVAQPRCKGSDMQEAQAVHSGATEEGLSHGWMARSEEGGGSPSGFQAKPEETAATCSPESAWLPSTASEEGAEKGWLGPTTMEEEDDGKDAGQEHRLAEDGGELEQSGLLESKCPAQGRGQQEVAAQSCCIQTEDVSSDEQECPICTELYDQDQRKPALLNCSHVLCGRCLRSIMEAASAADVGRVRCPICRQKTPMLEWEICKLQEELLLLSSEQGPASSGSPVFNVLPARRPGIWGSLEHHFQVRFHTTRMIGFLPCFRYPRCLIRGLARLEHRCRCCYLLALVALLAAEMLSLLLVFLPIVLLLLLFLILDK